MTILAFTPRPPDPVGPGLASHIATVTGLTITDAGVVGATPRGGLQANTCYVEGTITEANRTAIQNALNSYSYNPNFGMPTEDVDLKAVRAKAQAVFNSTDTFTAAQMQKLVAGLVLRATR